MPGPTTTYLLRIQAEGAEKTIAALKALGIQVQEFERKAKTSGASTKSLSDNLARLAGRAALTIPIWLGLRTAFTSTLGTINDTVQSMIELDAALKNVQNELRGTQGLEQFVDGLEQAARALSTQTGVAPAKIVETFRQFATAGLDAQTSLAGMTTAVKGAIATMGESEEIARILADVYNQFGDRITEVSGAQEKFNFIMGTIASLMPTNVFTIKEFTDALRNFIGTAKGANLTLDQTFTLVAASATAMQRGARGGTQLTSVFAQLALKAKDVRDFLGKPVEGRNQFEVLLEFLNKSADTLKATGRLPIEIEEIFGRKGGLDIKALTSDLDHFIDELNRLKNLTPEERNAQLIERFGTATEKISLQLDRLKQTREELGRIFLEGFGGADKAVELLKELNSQLGNLSTTARGLGEIFGKTFEGLGTLIKNSGLLELLGGVGPNFTGQADGRSFGSAFRQGLAALSPTNIVNAVGLHKEGATARDAAKAQEELNKNLELQLEIARRRKAAGLPDLRGPAGSPGPIELEPIVIKTASAINLKLQERLDLMDRLKTEGFNDLQIELKKLEILKERGGTQDEIHDKELDILKLINKEVIEASEKLRSSFQDALTDLLDNEVDLKGFFERISKTVRRGLLEAISGSITDQVFSATGIGELFGGTVFDLRHISDGVGGPIKRGFDYGGKVAYNQIIKAFRDGSNLLNSPEGAELLNQFPGFIPGGFGGATLPGFGPGGVFSGPGFGFRGQPVGTGANGGLINVNTGAAIPTLGQQLGGAAFVATTGFSAFQAAGGSKGSLSGPAGAFGALGGLALAAPSLGLGFGAGGAFAAGGGLAGLAPLLGPIGIGLLIGSALFAGFSKTKQDSVEEKTQERQVASRIDVTNKKLDVVNRNLVALRSDLQTFILPESAYFSTKINLDDQFAINSNQGVN